MSDVPDEKSLAGLLAKLKADHGAVPWRERRALAQSLADRLVDGEASDVAMSLLELLADDPKWEVRGDIGDLLLLVPDDHFAQLAAKLSEDTNSFVRKAAERALDRRRKGQHDSRQKRQGLDEVVADYATMEKLHGTLAAQMSRRICERLYDVLIGATVHNMRGVLTPVKASANTLRGRLQDGQLDEKTLRKHLAKIADGLSFLERLLDEMRAYSRAIPQKRRRERLIDLINQAYGTAVQNYSDRGYDAKAIELALSVPESITLDVSRHQIVVAFTNVLDNAFEAFIPEARRSEGQRIQITARLTENEHVEAVVEDNGIGFGEDDLKQIREFIPGHATLKQYGTGFGLPTAKRYIEAHGGQIGIDSQEDVGTRVTIFLPVESSQDNE